MVPSAMVPPQIACDAHFCACVQILATSPGLILYLVVFGLDPSVESGMRSEQLYAFDQLKHWELIYSHLIIRSPGQMVARSASEVYPSVPSA
jgi:hypothetical protein